MRFPWLAAAAALPSCTSAAAADPSCPADGCRERKAEKAVGRGAKRPAATVNMAASLNWGSFLWCSKPEIYPPQTVFYLGIWGSVEWL